MTLGVLRAIIRRVKGTPTSVPTPAWHDEEFDSPSHHNMRDMRVTDCPRVELPTELLEHMEALYRAARATRKSLD